MGPLVKSYTMPNARRHFTDRKNGMVDKRLPVAFTHRLLQKNDSAQLGKENKLLKNENAALRKTNSHLNKLLKIVRHDFGGMIGTVRGSLGLALSAKTDSEKEEDIARIWYSLDRASGFLDTISMWKDTDDIVISPKKIDLYDKTCLQFLLSGEKMDRKKIEWVNIIQPGTLVYADDECLNCILRNLVGNAIKFTRSDGEGRIMVSAGKNEGNVKISIKDNGIGIKPDDLPHVFNAYDRGISRDGTNNEPGTGFGLGIVKELVERNNGKVSVESEVGKGTTFTITLPAAKPDAI